MIKTYLYLPEELNKRVMVVADRDNLSKAQVLRTAIEEGLYKLDPQPGGNVYTLRDIANIGRKYEQKGPKDLSKNLDKYLWEDDK